MLHANDSVELVAQYHDGILDMVYHDATNFESKKIQKWLRELLRNTILRIAKVILPARVKYWEDMKGIHGTGVTVKRLRKNVLGQCSHSNHITLQPFLVIFKQEWADGVILHEMAHYKYKALFLKNSLRRGGGFSRKFRELKRECSELHDR